MSLRLVREFFNGGWNYRAEEEAAAGGGGSLTLRDSGDLLFENIVWAGSPEVPGDFAFATGTVILSAWAVMDWDFDGATWVNTGALTECLFQLILAKPDNTSGVDVVTYDLIDDQPSGDGSLVEFSPLIQAANFNATTALQNLRRAAVTTHASQLFMTKSGDPSGVTGRFRVFALTA